MSTFRHADPTRMGRFEKSAAFFKVENGVAYGWAIVCTENGEDYWDLQQDHIPEDEMVSAALDFMKHSRVGSDQHTGDHVGDIVFAYPVTKATSALGITSTKTGLLIGYQPQDSAQLDLIARGERTGFSIGGYLLDYDLADVGKAVKAIAARKSRRGAAVAKGSPDASDVYTPSEVGTKGKAKDKKKRGKVYRQFKIDEISLVTKPAQEGATVAFVKGAVIAKADYDLAFTSSDDGHQHVVDTDSFDGDGRGCTSCAITADGEWHSHEWLRKDDGTIDIADNAGHGHSVDAKASDLPDPADVPADDKPSMTSTVAGGEVLVVQLAAPAAPARNSTSSSDRGSVQSKSKDTQENTMTPEQIEALNKRLHRAEKMAELSDAQRAFAKSLGEQGLDDYLAKSPAERTELAKGSIEYTAADGTVYYKHNDPQVISLAKSADKLKADLVLEQQLRKDAQFSKAAAEDMGSLEGDDKTHVAVIAAIEGIADEGVRKSARDLIRSANAAVAKLARPTGHNGAVGGKGGQSAVSAFEKAQTDMKVAVEKYQTDHKLGSYAEAFAEATQKDPGIRKLYEQIAELRSEAN